MLFEVYYSNMGFLFLSNIIQNLYWSSFFSWQEVWEEVCQDLWSEVWQEVWQEEEDSKGLLLEEKHSKGLQKFYHNHNHSQGRGNHIYFV